MMNSVLLKEGNSEVFKFGKLIYNMPKAFSGGL
jgi:hypothetical protein